MKIYVVIVTFNGSQWISKCLTSLISYDYKIIVIDNASTDNTIKIVERKFPNVVLIENKDNFGFGKANNIGIKKAYDENADYVFLLNQDAWIESNTIEQLVEIGRMNDDYGIISPVHINGQNTGLDYKFSNYIVPKNCPNFYSDLYMGKLKNDIYPVKFVNAAAWLISRNCIKTVGGFNPFFFMYGEDDDYINRVHYHGFKVGIYPYARIYHDREQLNKSSYFVDNYEMLKRNFFLTSCDINHNYDIKYNLNELFFSILKSLIKIKFYDIKMSSYKLKLLLKHHKDIQNSRLKSKQNILTFL